MSQPVNYKIQNNVLKINFGIFCFYDLEMFYLYITTSLMRKLAYRITGTGTWYPAGIKLKKEPD